MSECFTKISYTKSGILTLIIKQEEPEIQRFGYEWPETFLNGLAPIDNAQVIQRVELFSYMCEINNNGKYQTAAEMLDQFTQKNRLARTGFSHDLINTKDFTSLNSVFIEDFKNI